MARTILTSGSSSAPAIASRREQSKKVQEHDRATVKKVSAREASAVRAVRAVRVNSVLSLGATGVRLSDCNKLILDHEICDCSFCESKLVSFLDWFSLTPAPLPFVDLRPDSVGSLQEAITSIDEEPEEPEAPSVGFRSIADDYTHDAFSRIYSRIDPIEDFDTYDAFRPSCVPWEDEIDVDL